jgi:hypothetical protein
VQLIGQIPEPVLAEIAGWFAVVASLAVFAVLIRLDQARKPRQNEIAPVCPAHAFEPGIEFKKVMDVSLAEILLAPDLQSIQAQAATQIDAAEHAFNRLLAECARVTTPIVSPTFQTMRQLAREPASAPRRQQPLAA